jgi:hypothetical protein
MMRIFQVLELTKLGHLTKSSAIVYLETNSGA